MIQTSQGSQMYLSWNKSWKLDCIDFIYKCNTARAHLAGSYDVLTLSATQFSCKQINCKNLIAYPFRVLHFYATLAHVLSSA